MELHRALVAALFVMVSFLLIGCGSERKGPEAKPEPNPAAKISDAQPKSSETVSETPKPKPTAVEAKPLPGVKPDFALSSTKYAEEQQKDEKAYQAKYKNKVVELAGLVKKVLLTRGEGRIGMVMLEGFDGGKDALFKDVTCYTTDNKPWEKCMPGQTVKLRGKFPESAFGAALYECQVVEAMGPRPATVTVAQLAKTFEKDPADGKKELKALGAQLDFLVVSGEVADVQLKDLKFALKVIEPKSFSVWVHFSDDDKAAIEKLKPGQRVEVLGSASYVGPDAGRILGLPRGVGLGDSILLSK